MRCFLFVVLSLAAPLGTSALTWDFVEDTTWGWAAQESFTVSIGSRATATTVRRSEVADGVWRIAPALGSWSPSIQLLSPLVGEDSALFDRRHPAAAYSSTIVLLRGGARMSWFNAEGKRLYEMQESLGLRRDFLTWIFVPTSLRPTGKRSS